MPSIEFYDISEACERLKVIGATLADIGEIAVKRMEACYLHFSLVGEAWHIVGGACSHEGLRPVQRLVADAVLSALEEHRYREPGEYKPVLSLLAEKLQQGPHAKYRVFTTTPPNYSVLHSALEGDVEHWDPEDFLVIIAVRSYRSAYP